MTIQEAIDKADQMKENILPDAMKIAALNEIEGKIHEEILMTHAHSAEEETPPAFDIDTDPGTVLLAPDRYAMLYVYWIMSRMDLTYQEMDKFNNNMALFQMEYGNLQDWWNRRRMPVQRNRQIRI